MRWACQEVASRAEEEDSSTDSSPKLSSSSPGMLAVSPWFVLLNSISRFAILVPFSLPVAIATSTEQLLLSKWLVPDDEMQTDLCKMI